MPDDLPPVPEGPVITSVYAPEEYQDELDATVVGRPVPPVDE